MKNNLHRKPPYFKGWYVKLQTKSGQALGLIPAFHKEKDGSCCASLQVITGHQSWFLQYPFSDFSCCSNRFLVRVGQCCFAKNGLRLCIEKNGLSLHGAVSFGPFLPLSSDIMGPFRLLPMECSHGVLSMAHRLRGTLTLNGEPLVFDGGMGYLETDEGRSFPERYLWIQSTCPGTAPFSLMLSIAKIPVGKLHFTGTICAIFHEGKEYRLATHWGARARRWSEDGAEIQQGTYRLLVTRLKGTSHPLQAPVHGCMCRTVRESLSCAVHYEFWIGNQLLLGHTDPFASFEFAP